MPRNILIVGASIAGPCAAYWFARAGATVTVIERFPRLRTNGQNVDIRTVGVSVMRRTPGMEAAVRAKIVPFEGFSMVDTHGKRFATMVSTGNPDSQSLISEYEIYRGDLSSVLVDLGEERVRYVFGTEIASMTQIADSVKVEFTANLPPTTFDLVVACDGAASRTRSMIMGNADATVPVNCWAAYFTTPDMLAGGLMGKAHSSIPGRFMSVHPDPRGTNRVLLMSVYPNSASIGAFREAQRNGTTKQYIGQRFADAGWKATTILQGMMDTDDFYASEIIQVKVPRLYSGRVVLVGDAGYAAGPTGGGTSLAMAGAYVLAGELSKHPDNLLAGLQAYQDRMRPIIDDMQQIPLGVPGVMAPQTAWGLSVRNMLFTFVGWLTRVQRYVPWASPLLGWWASAFGGDKHRLPDYWGTM